MPYVSKFPFILINDSDLVDRTSTDFTGPRADYFALFANT